MNNHWQPIETAPRDGTSILAVIPGYEPRLCEWVVLDGVGKWCIYEEEFSEHEHFMAHFYDSNYSPLFWMELPKFDGVINK